MRRRELPGDGCDARQLGPRHSLSRTELVGHRQGWNALREMLFLTMHHTAADGAAVLHLPTDRTIVMGARIDLG